MAYYIPSFMYIALDDHNLDEYLKQLQKCQGSLLNKKTSDNIRDVVDDCAINGSGNPQSCKNRNHYSN